MWFCLISISQVLLLKWIHPVSSSFMMSRQLHALASGDWHNRIDYRWRDLENISSQLPLAVVASEDQRFPVHHGFDFAAIEKAYKSNLRGKKVRGASTISQQLAKNLFLWSGRSYVRKALEAWYTFWIELLWSKKRILEVYVNVVEFGDGVYGAEAAAKRFYGTSAKALSRRQSATLAAVLPNPKIYNAVRPGPYVKRRSKAIERQMRALGGTAYLSSCCLR
ncbi:MAG: monofunctional biosynthetic peptidoglycan transglycosylase [Arenimonas sp.]|nr:monofunctional biosynthetic peptidoglycan transglycosylase [Arenimonas sp.]